jgi:hypothetical protein
MPNYAKQIIEINFGLVESCSIFEVALKKLRFALDLPGKTNQSRGPKIFRALLLDNRKSPAN